MRRVETGEAEDSAYVGSFQIRIRLFSGTKPKCKRTNVKQVVTMSIHYIKDKIKKTIRHNKIFKDEDTKKIVI